MFCHGPEVMGLNPGEVKRVCVCCLSNSDINQNVVSRGAVRSAASSYAAVRMVAGSRPVLVIAWEWHIGLALLCGCSGALEYPTTNSCGPINKSLILNIKEHERNSIRTSCSMHYSIFHLKTHGQVDKAMDSRFKGIGFDPTVQCMHKYQETFSFLLLSAKLHFSL